jgi:hypothetical protein
MGGIAGAIPPGPALEPLAQAMAQEGKGMRFLQPADSTLLQPALDLLQEVRRLKQSGSSGLPSDRLRELRD